MNEPEQGGPSGPEQDPTSLVSQVSFLLRWRRTIVGCSLAFAFLGLAAGLFSRKVYRSSAMFLPEMSEMNVSAGDLALAASQFGLNIPQGGGSWGPPLYVALLRSRALLLPIAQDTVVVVEEGGRRVAVVDLLEITGATPEERIDRAVLVLRNIVSSQEAKTLNAVEMSVTTRWPSVSLAIAEHLVSGVNRFNIETHRSQASAERQFIETRLTESEGELREAEDRLQLFLQRNRSLVSSPELSFARDRLQREVALRQQVYTGLTQSREDARAREVRDTPVISLLEPPRLPILRESRRTALKAALGLLGGGILGVVIAFLLEGVVQARRSPTPETEELFRLVDDTVPSFIRRWSRR